MGFDPHQVGRMTPWQFMACLDQFARSNGWSTATSRDKPMSIERMRELGIEGV